MPAETPLERFSDGYVSGDLREREDDIVWKLRLRDGWLRVYLLLEFQSSVDYFMAAPIWACCTKTS